MLATIKPLDLPPPYTALVVVIPTPLRLQQPTVVLERLNGG